jgi:GAF domain-containing protein
METNLNATDEQFSRATAELAELRRFPGVPKEFWPRFLAASAQLAISDVAVILLGRPGQTPHWQKIGDWSAGPGQPRLRKNFNDFLEQGATRAANDGSFIERDDESTDAFVLGLRLKLARPEDEVVLITLVVDFTESAARDAVTRLALAADTPALYQGNLASRQATADVEKFATVLDLMVPVNAEKRFLAALLALSNGVATRFVCDRVSVGWQDRGYIRLQAISRTEKFDRQMAAAQSLEALMEECADQDEEVFWPVSEGATAVTRDHEKFAREQSVAHLCSIPLRVDGKVIGVVVCERQGSPFGTVEMQQLRLLCDQLTPRLSELKRLDRWFGARLVEDAREMFARSLGPEHTWPKVFAGLGVLVLALLFLVRWSYRAQGTFIVRSEAVSFLTAPFDGYVDRVAVRTGDFVPKGGEIVALNRAELLLEQSSAAAEIARYERETEKARAAKQLAEMRIAEALAEQARARLALVNHRLDVAIMKAPFAGVVVEGDLRERIGAPVKVGEPLYKVARIDGLYVEAELDERDVRDIIDSKRAEFAFVSQPKKKYAASVVTIEPAALAKKDANVFLVRLQPDDAPENWWRPGMTGIAKISVGKRSLWWILTHRTVDFLRLKLWW